MGSEKPFKSTRCNSPSDLTAVPGEGANQLELDQLLASRLQEMYKTEDSDLQEMYSNEDSGQLQEMHNTEDPVTHKEGTSSAMNLTDSSSVAKALAEMVDKSGQLFIVVRRDSLLKRVLSIWNREVSKTSGSAHPVVKVNFGGKERIDSSAMAREFYISSL